MDFYLGLAQIVGVHTLLGLSAYCVLLTGQVSLAQAGFFAVGAQRNLVCVFRFMDDHADVPVHAQDINAEDILSLLGGNIWHSENLLSVFDALFS